VTDSGTDRRTDGRTDGRTGVSKERAIAYMLSRANEAYSKVLLHPAQPPPSLTHISSAVWDQKYPHTVT